MAPKHKKGSRDDLSNYRPVSTIIEIAKITETAAHDQVRDHFIKHNLLHPGHHGGIPKLDTTTALLEVQRFNIEAAESKKVSGTVLLDQSLALDLMDHKILLEKLEAYNFDSNAINWFSSYLSDRTFRVQIESKRSQPRSLGPYAVPQGSVLGCLLFVISQNDLPTATTDDNDCKTVCYVDDETEQVSDTNPMRLQQRLQDRVNNAVTWLEDNKMVISPDKSKFIISMTNEQRAIRHPNLSISINVNNTTITATPSEKLLGVVISQDMTWTPFLWGGGGLAEQEQPPEPRPHPTPTASSTTSLGEIQLQSQDENLCTSHDNIQVKVCPSPHWEHVGTRRLLQPGTAEDILQETGYNQTTVNPENSLDHDPSPIPTPPIHANY